MVKKVAFVHLSPWQVTTGQFQLRRPPENGFPAQVGMEFPDFFYGSLEPGNAAGGARFENCVDCPILLPRKAWAGKLDMLPIQPPFRTYTRTQPVHEYSFAYSP